MHESLNENVADKTEAFGQPSLFQYDPNISEQYGLHEAYTDKTTGDEKIAERA